MRLRHLGIALTIVPTVASAIGVYEHTMACQTYYIEQCYDTFTLTVMDRDEINRFRPLYLEYDVVQHTRHVDAEVGMNPTQSFIASFGMGGAWTDVPVPMGHMGQHMRVDISWMLDNYMFQNYSPLKIYGGGLQWVDRPDDWIETIQAGGAPWYNTPVRLMVENMTLTQASPPTDFSLTAPVSHAPEPETWALMLAGLVASIFRVRNSARRAS